MHPSHLRALGRLIELGIGAGNVPAKHGANRHGLLLSLGDALLSIVVVSKAPVGIGVAGGSL